MQNIYSKKKYKLIIIILKLILLDKIINLINKTNIIKIYYKKLSIQTSINNSHNNNRINYFLQPIKINILTLILRDIYLKKLSLI